MKCQEQVRQKSYLHHEAYCSGIHDANNDPDRELSQTFEVEKLTCTWFAGKLWKLQIGLHPTSCRAVST